MSNIKGRQLAKKGTPISIRQLGEADLDAVFAHLSGGTALPLLGVTRENMVDNLSALEEHGMIEFQLGLREIIIVLPYAGGGLRVRRATH